MYLCFLVCLNFNFCGHHRGGVLDLRRVSSSWALQTFFAQHVHGGSGVNHECGRRHCPDINRSIKRRLSAFLSLYFFAKSHATPRAHLFLGVRFRLVSCPQISWGSHFCTTPCDGPFPEFIWATCLWIIWRCDFDPNFPSFRWIDFLGWGSWDTIQLYRL